MPSNHGHIGFSSGNKPGNHGSTGSSGGNKPEVSPLKDVTLKITESAWEKYLYARDYRTDEVTLFGITKREDPLFVEDFEIIKQKVHNTSSDAEDGAMEDHINANLAKTPPVLPVNCDRIWAHTHPMTGEHSAKPSGKDWSTFTDEDNRQKSFLVMLILSKSGHVSCHIKLYNDAVGTNTYHSISLEIVKEDLEDRRRTAIDRAIREALSAEQIQVLNEILSIKNTPVQLRDEVANCGIETYDPEWVSGFAEKYKNLVTKDSFVTTSTYLGNHYQGVGFQSTYNTKQSQVTISERNALGILCLFNNTGMGVKHVLSWLGISFEDENWKSSLSKLTDDEFKQALNEMFLDKMADDTFLSIPFQVRSKTVITVSGERYFNKNFATQVKKAILSREFRQPSKFDLICTALTSGNIKFNVNGKGEMRMDNDIYSGGPLEVFKSSLSSRLFYDDYLVYLSDSIFGGDQKIVAN